MVGCSGYPYVGSSIGDEVGENERKSECIRNFLTELCLVGESDGADEEGGTGHGVSRTKEISSGGTSVRIGLVVVTGSGVGGTGGGISGLGGISGMGWDEGGGQGTIGWKFVEEEMPSVFAVGDPRYERVDAIKTLSSSVRVERLLAVGLVQTVGDCERVLHLDDIFHFEGLTSMSSQPDLSSSVKGRERGLVDEFGSGLQLLRLFFRAYISVKAG